MFDGSICLHYRCGSSEVSVFIVKNIIPETRNQNPNIGTINVINLFIGKLESRFILFALSKYFILKL